ncbi:DUF1281 domain-containing protein [Salmonella enterica]|uniref:DUF1281 domain-containing protein n=2 Tax=Salmonella enterica TaxID=28901 RepID=A0A763Z1Z6_SALER|nr:MULTISPECIES: DUF1281 domain-containing protein [Enterobacteriaceae]EBY8685156.1 DUF1281 domain-containing protein [Salmonella enterica subsp. enterica serovar Agona]EKG5011681.1 DUF1281 domain-containing protein [Salmonella enterica]CAX68174.1 conserved hypothetical protein [Salmonella enterica subsp. enterica] [Salmonella enterica subsp. enterica serovar Senftenberg]EKG5048358.1 DUF1281 domain-containing protein [Salmonella enterica]EKG5053970.1 DUF1281 domain-containing protein [Salmonel
MFSWCNNRLDITGKSVCLDVMQSWISGTETPLYRHAIRQAIRLFLAGCAGLLKPVKATEYAPYPQLVSVGTGSSVAPNQAFQHFLELLEKDAWLDGTTVSRMEKIYLQSGLSAVKWDNLPFTARQIMTHLMALHYADWFGMAGAGSAFDPQEHWEWLGERPETTCPCDMLMVMPSRLATELNGTSGLFRGVNETPELYMQLFGTEYPAGQNVEWFRDGINTLSVTFTSPWYPPSGEVMGEMSQFFDCEIRHYWKSPDVRISGYNCFDRGDHVDSGAYPEEVVPVSAGEGARMYLVSPDTPPALSAPASHYAGLRS